MSNWEICWWVGVSWLAYVYVGYPLLMAALGWRRASRAEIAEDYRPSVSVLIAARNEEKDIGWKLRETLAWDYPADRLEVLVASDASEDGTDQILGAFEDPRLRWTRMEQRGGKVRALNRLAALARGEILFFTDANASISHTCLKELTKYFADPRVGCVTGTSRPAPCDDVGAIRHGASAYFRYESWVSRLESRLGAVLACDGAIHCVRRSLYSPLLPELANDLELPLRVRHAGYRVLFEPKAFAVEKETDSAREEFERRRRIAAQGALAMWRLRRLLRGMLGWQFVSHKLLRWLTPVPLALVLVGAAAQIRHPLFGAGLVAQVLFYAAALAGALAVRRNRKVPPVLAVPFYAVSGALAAFVGVLEACQGRSFAVWESPVLSRGASHVQR